MATTLLQAVIRTTEARTTDAELLDRFVRNRDEPAFEELVRRHGPLVWSVCRQMLPHHSDAEDAFQAVFLALIQGAATIRAGQALPAWLHGVAVRVAEKAKRTLGRRRQREVRAAVGEANHPVPDTAWAGLMAAVHEEVQRLPDCERTAFVLCELEGVRQPEAAARLGWPLGTLSGRLCKARQRLIEQLTRRGIVPGVLAIGGLASSTGVAPAALVARVSSFPSATANGVTSAVAKLAHGLVGGATMRTKLLAATILVAGALGITGTSMVLSDATAQNNPGSPAGSGEKNSGALGQLGGASAGQPGAPGRPSGVPTPANPAAPLPGAQGAPLMPGGGMGMMGGMIPNGPPSNILGPVTWDYKFIDLKSDDRDAFEKEIKQAGTQGWEFCGSERLRKANDGAPLVLVFKKRHGTGVQEWAAFLPSGGFGVPVGGFGGGPGAAVGIGGGGMVGGFGPGFGPGAGAAGGIGGGAGGAAVGYPQMRVEVGGSGKELRFDVDMGKTGSTSMAALAAGADPKAIMMGSYKLNNTNAADVENALKQHFGDKLALTGTKLVTDPGSNCIAVRVESNPELFKEITRIIEQLDANRPKPQPARGQGFPVLPGPIPLATPGLAVQENAASANLVAASKITVLKLSHANAADLATVLQKVFGSAVEITAEPRSNQLIIRAPEQTLVEVTKLLKQLDVSTPSGQGGPYSM